MARSSNPSQSSMNQAKIHNLHSLLAEMRHAYKGQQEVSVDALLARIGRRSFGPLLLAVGAIYSAPVIGDIPGVPIILGALLIIVAAQLVIGREHIWLPDVLLRQSVRAENMDKTLRWMEKPAQYIDRLIKPRLRQFTGSAATMVIVVAVSVIALATPAMEFVPFSANIAGLAILSFGLGLVAHDGLFNLIGLVFFLTVCGIVVYVFL